MTVAYLTRDSAALRAASTAIQLDGDHYVAIAPDGTREKVPLHRPDIATAIASGLLSQSATRQPARPHKAARMGMTWADVDMLSDVLGIAFDARDARIAALERTSGATSKPAQQPARAAATSARSAKLSGHAVRLLATAAVASARATLALR